MASLTADEISSLVQAASDAAQAASSAAQALRDAQTSRASNSRFHEASKVVRLRLQKLLDNQILLVQRSMTLT